VAIGGLIYVSAPYEKLGAEVQTPPEQLGRKPLETPGHKEMVTMFPASRE
jgi:hypothetical protein